MNDQNFSENLLRFKQNKKSLLRVTFSLRLQKKFQDFY